MLIFIHLVKNGRVRMDSLIVNRGIMKKYVILALGLLFLGGCATPTANSPVINVNKIVYNGIFVGSCMKDDKGRVSCPKVKHDGAITSTYTTGTDIKPVVKATQKTTASPTFDTKVTPGP